MSRDMKMYHAAVTEAWNYFKKWSAMLPLSGEQWTEALREGGAITKAFPKEYRQFIADELVTKVNELERIERDKKQNGI